MRRTRLGVAQCAVVALTGCAALAGCTAGSHTNDPAPTSARAEPSFDPCAIPDEALRAVGVEPSTEDFGVFGVQYAGWQVCSWEGAARWYYLSVFASTRGIDEVRNNPRNTDITPVQIGTRSGFTSRETDDTAREACDVNFGNEYESIIVRAERAGLDEFQEDPCVVAVRSARGLDAALPTY